MTRLEPRSSEYLTNVTEKYLTHEINHWNFHPINLE